MLQVTSEARRHLVALRTKRGFDVGSGARFLRDSGRLGLTFTPSPEQGDRIVETPDINVYLAPNVAEQLDRSVVDAREVEGKVSLVARPQPEGGASRSTSPG